MGTVPGVAQRGPQRVAVTVLLGGVDRGRGLREVERSHVVGREDVQVQVRHLESGHQEPDPRRRVHGADRRTDRVRDRREVGQQLGAPLSALGQPLQQLPQQVMQGLGQVAQSAGTAETGDSQRSDGEADEPAAGAESGAAPGSGTAPVAAGDQAGDDGTRRAN